MRANPHKCFAEDHSLDHWISEGIDSKTKVVFGNCNETWMSDIENRHAIPVLKPMITGSSTVPITRDTARSLAIFSFKTAVVLDHARRVGDPFFPPNVRANFMNHLTIPADVQMWVCGFGEHRNNVHIKAVYNRGNVEPAQLSPVVCMYLLRSVMWPSR